MLIENLKLFLRIVEKGGLAAAGREVGLSPATVTDRLAALEAHYGARLLTRTTRSISLTDEGRELVTGARRILAETEETEARIRLGVEKISGTIHLSAPSDLGRNQIVPLLDRFMTMNPEVAIDLSLSDSYVDLVGRGLDLAIRYGELSDSTMKASRLGENRRLVCAAPAYLELNGTPLHPVELAHHNCLVMRFGSNTDQDWSFVIDGEKRTCRVRGNRIADDGDLIRQWCLNGHGVAFKSEWDIRDDLETGRLVELLEDFTPEPSALQMVYPAGTVQPRRVRALMEFLSKKFVR
ncbi:LysR family transcriptional regulator [uncultured Roseobacter sp.]|uniref:LysR family transcriptional regulator n=1 Tax=uncultured Roseobacter sp. TaxID=114847 RepID=UPI0026233124|nr:LysR family transcriptional regulator [uncultured Roseobacter sp.]